MASTGPEPTASQQQQILQILLKHYENTLVILSNCQYAQLICEIGSKNTLQYDQIYFESRERRLSGFKNVCRFFSTASKDHHMCM